MTDRRSSLLERGECMAWTEGTFCQRPAAFRFTHPSTGDVTLVCRYHTRIFGPHYQRARVPVEMPEEAE